MAKQTVQGMMIEQLNRLESKMDKLIPVVEGLKVKAAIAGGISGIVGTAVATALVGLWRR